MAELVARCPRCGARHITFDVTGSTRVDSNYGWQTIHEAFCVCRHCHCSTVFVLAESGIDEAKAIQKTGLVKVPGSINDLVRVTHYISTKDEAGRQAPEHLPQDLKRAFDEGATCAAVGCYNAAACMFRLCIDLATRPLLPVEETVGLTRRIRRDLGLRLPWLFENKLLQEALRDLSTCIREDGNDGAHAGTIDEAGAEDLADFTVMLLERLYTEPARLRLAQERRDARRNPESKP
jgi:hypothetical protein